MKRLLSLLLALALCAGALPAAGLADGYTTKDFAGRRFECLYEIVDGQKRLLDADERPYVEFLDDIACDFQDAYAGSYIVNEGRLAVMESGYVPMYTFYIPWTRLSAFRARPRFCTIPPPYAKTARSPALPPTKRPAKCFTRWRARW